MSDLHNNQLYISLLSMITNVKVYLKVKYLKSMLKIVRKYCGRDFSNFIFFFNFKVSHHSRRLTLIKQLHFDGIYRQ